ncbi:hypothetical protein AGMMS49975_05810 [Clostridia bacterium]|nr:hypothetical protein AGMMS49975_05810 [Clostridia bacterium]
MTTQETIENAKVNIKQAVRDYRRHTTATDVLDNITDEFIYRLAEDNTHAKKDLRELFSKSPVWDEKLDALVINGTRTHNPDSAVITDLAEQILHPAFVAVDNDVDLQLPKVIKFFAEADSPFQEEYIAAIKAIAPKAYAPNKKPSRIFRSICDVLNITDDNAGSPFQRLYARFADELTAKKISFKLFVSLNPAHFLTMSNPKNDERGNTLTSCHSLNSTEYQYNVGCTGYAWDETSFIIFTASDPKDSETLNNRKTTRQIFAYKPGNGLLLQSRLYNTSGGTQGAQEESKLYRDLVQREISELEDAANLWKTHSCLNSNYSHCVDTGDGFGGYADWIYESFDGKVSIRNGSEESYESLTVGTFGLCISCGKEISSGLYCGDCDSGDDGYCAHCGERVDPDDIHIVYDRHGNEEEVCDYCRDEHYSYCEHCGDYHANDRVTEVAGGDWVCDRCLDEYYTYCDDCEQYYRNEDTYTVYDARGRERQVCRDCRDDHYVQCSHCEEFVHEDSIIQAHDVNGNDIEICNECLNKHYTECEGCGDIFDNGTMVSGYRINA